MTLACQKSRCLKKAIREIFQENKSRKNLRYEVTRHILGYYKDGAEMAGFFSDLSHYGCICGMVRSLIYYNDTHAFFNRHYDEIEELRENLEDSLGEPIRIKGDLKNFFAWLAFEETAREIAQDVGLEV